MPASVQLDDLIQAGMLGLLEAAQKYDDTKGASFETYAGIRIKGAMVDEMRRGDWVPRSVHRNARKISQALASLEASLGREACDAEVAAHLEPTIDEYQALLADTQGSRLFSYNEDIDDEDSCASADDPAPPQDPAKSVAQTHLQSFLAAAIAELPEREQLVLSLYYEQEMNLGKLALVLGVSESRVSQIHPRPLCASKANSPVGRASPSLTGEHLVSLSANEHLFRTSIGQTSNRQDAAQTRIC